MRPAASRPDDGTRREEDLEDWVPEVPYIEEVMQLIHILHAVTSRRSGSDPPPRSDLGSRREEDFEDSVPEVPYIEEVMQLIHILRWPGVVQRIDGWTCVVVPVYADVADALEHNLHALGAVAPASEPGAGAGADRGAGAPTRADAALPEETHPALAEDILLDAEEVN